MKTITYYSFEDKENKLGPGPWQDEPDKMQWLDEETGYPCLAKRNPHMGMWCGYVGVPRDHPCYGKHYDEADEGGKLNVHGGLTFADKCHAGNEFTNICHAVEEDEDDDVWWLGFDCGHCDDIIPGMLHRERTEWSKLPGWPGNLYEFGQEYRNLPYVQQECHNLAKQLKELSNV